MREESGDPLSSEVCIEVEGSERDNGKASEVSFDKKQKRAPSDLAETRRRKTSATVAHVLSCLCFQAKLVSWHDPTQDLLIQGMLVSLVPPSLLARKGLNKAFLRALLLWFNEGDEDEEHGGFGFQLVEDGILRYDVSSLREALVERRGSQLQACQLFLALVQGLGFVARLCVGGVILPSPHISSLNTYVSGYSTKLREFARQVVYCEVLIEKKQSGNPFKFVFVHPLLPSSLDSREPIALFVPESLVDSVSQLSHQNNNRRAGGIRSYANPYFPSSHFSKSRGFGGLSKAFAPFSLPQPQAFFVLAMDTLGFMRDCSRKFLFTRREEEEEEGNTAFSMDVTSWSRLVQKRHGFELLPPFHFKPLFLGSRWEGAGAVDRYRAFLDDVECAFSSFGEERLMKALTDLEDVEEEGGRRGGGRKRRKKNGGDSGAPASHLKYHFPRLFLCILESPKESLSALKNSNQQSLGCLCVCVFPLSLFFFCAVVCGVGDVVRVKKYGLTQQFSMQFLSPFFFLRSCSSNLPVCRSSCLCILLTMLTFRSWEDMMSR